MKKLLLLVLSIATILSKTTFEDRRVKIKNIQLIYVKDFTNYRINDSYILSNDQSATGRIQFYPKSQYWQIDFNNGGIQLENQQSQSILERIFEENIGKYAYDTENNNLTSMNFIKPEEKSPNFEHSKLNNKCYKIDIFPPSGQKSEHLIFQFCVLTEKEDETISKYRHILEDKELGKKNNE